MFVGFMLVMIIVRVNVFHRRRIEVLHDHDSVVACGRTIRQRKRTQLKCPGIIEFCPCGNAGLWASKFYDPNPNRLVILKTHGSGNWIRGDSPRTAAHSRRSDQQKRKVKA